MNKLDLKLFFQNRFSDWLKDDIFEIYLFQSNNELFIESTLGIQKYKNSILVDYYNHNFTLDQSIEKNLTDLVNIEDDFFFLELDHLFKKEFIENELVIFLNSTSINYYYEKIMNPESDINENSWIFTFDILPSKYLNTVYITDLILPFTYKESLKRFLKKGLPALIYFDLNEKEFINNLKDNDIILNNLYKNTYFYKYENLVDELMKSENKNFENFIEIIINSKFLFEENTFQIIRLNPKKVCHFSTFSFDILEKTTMEKLNQDITLKIEFLQDLNLIKFETSNFETKIDFQYELEIESFDEEYSNYEAIFNSLKHKELITEYFDFLTYIKRRINHK
jgi:hypothetical protein